MSSWIPDWAKKAADAVFNTDLEGGERRGSAHNADETERGQIWGNRVALKDNWNSTGGQQLSYANHAVDSAMENFSSYSRDQIASFLDAIKDGEMSDHSRSWNNLATDAGQAAFEFRSGMHSLIDNAWQGTSAEAAKAGISKYVDGEDDLVIAGRLMANKIEEFRVAVAESKSQLPDSTPHNSVLMGFVKSIPVIGGDVSAISDLTGSHDAADQGARAVMNSIYVPHTHQADDQVPMMPAPVNPLADNTSATTSPTGSGYGPAPDNSGAGAGTGPLGQTHDPGTNLTGANQNPNSAPPPPTSAAAANHGGAGPSGAGQASADGNSIAAPQTAAAGYGAPSQFSPVSIDGSTDSGLGPDAGGLGADSSLGGGSLGGGSLGGDALGAPTLGGGSAGTGRAAAGPVGTGRAGTPGSGMPGLGRGGKKPEDKEHHTPDWLRSTKNGELLTSLNGMRIAPGVIGLFDDDGNPVDEFGQRLR